MSPELLKWNYPKMETSIVVALIGLGGTCLGLAATVSGIRYGALLNRTSAIETAKQMADLDHYKFTKQRLWEERKSIYERIFEHLSIMHGCASLMSYYLFSNKSDPPERYMDSNEHKMHEQDFHKAFGDIHVLMKQHALVLSDDFIEKYEQWRHDLWKDGIDEGVEYAQYMHFDKIMSAYLAAFKEIGRREISMS